ncbi:MAG: hypothetical protein ABW321_13150 [Polyangiales bacterium]
MALIDLQRRILALCFCAEVDDAALAALGDARAFRAYREMVRERLWSQIRSALPRTAALVPAAAFERAFVWQLANAPPRSRYFRDCVSAFVASALPLWAAEDGVPPSACDLARYELALWEVGDLDDARDPSVSDFDFDRIPALSRALRLLRVEHAVHLTRRPTHPSEHCATRREGAASNDGDGELGAAVGEPRLSGALAANSEPRGAHDGDVGAEVGEPRGAAHVSGALAASSEPRVASNDGEGDGGAAVAEPRGAAHVSGALAASSDVGPQADAPVAGAYHLLVHRAADTEPARVWVVNATTFGMLQRMAAGTETVSGSVRALAAESGATLDARYVDALCETLAQLIELGVVLGSR